MRLNRALGIAIAIGISTALACGDVRTAAPAGSMAGQIPTTTPSPSEKPTPLPTASSNIQVSQCNQGNHKITRVLIECGNVALEQPSVSLPKMFYHFDPKVPQVVREHIEYVGSKYLPLYSGFFDEISSSAQIHVVLSLTPKWCGRELLKTDDGTEEFLRQNYCNQDGGANGGHGTMKYSEYGSIILRPHPTEVTAIKNGDVSSDMLTEIFIAELGHASRDVGADAMSGERGIAKWIPAWLGYVPNQFGWFYAGTVEGQAPDDYFLATWSSRDLAWRPTVKDKRFLAWNLGGELGNMERPSLYNVAYLAARYLVPRHGLAAITRDLMGTLIKSNGDYDRAAKKLGYEDWNALESAVDESIWSYYQEQGISLPD